MKDRTKIVTDNVTDKKKKQTCDLQKGELKVIDCA